MAFVEQVNSVSEKSTSSPTAVTESGEALKTLRRQLKDVRRSNTAMKKRLADRAGEVSRLKTTLREEQATVARQVGELEGRNSELLISALLERKHEIDALTATIATHVKEMKRLTALVATRDKALAKRKEERLTEEHILANINAVRVELFQYIFERTSMVERLEAYIVELKARLPS